VVGGRGHERGLDVDRRRHQQRLAHPAPVSQPSQKAVVDNTLVGGVLVDEDKAVGALCHQVPRTELTQRPQVYAGCRWGGDELLHRQRQAGLARCHEQRGAPVEDRCGCRR
jgi:hypothetical protein